MDTVLSPITENLKPAEELACIWKIIWTINCSECNFSDPDPIESLFVEINVPKGKNIVTGIICRPPNQNTAAFVNKLNDILAIITRGNKQCYIMGDFNLDLLQYNDNVLTQEFVNRLFSYAFCPLISKPTRNLR